MSLPPLVPFLNEIDNLIVYTFILMAGLSTLIGIKKNKIPKLKINLIEKKIINKALDELQQVKYELSTTIFGVDYEDGERFEIALQ